MEPQEVQALVRKLVGGSSDAWRRFVDHYSGWVLRVARATLRRSTGRVSEPDAEDAAADVFRQLVDRNFALLRTLRPPYHMRAWLAIIARRACLKTIQKRPRPATAEPAAPPSPETARLAEALQKLPMKDRALLEMFFIHDASYEEISQVLGIAIDSIGSLKFRALAKLKEIF